jgi:hypothetical protein
MPEQAGDVRSARSRKRKKRREGIMVFARVQMKLIRMGRAVATYRGDYATLDMRKGRVDFERNVVASVAGAKLSAAKVRVDLKENRLSADGRVSISEQGVDLVGLGMTARPSLTGIKFGKQIRLRAKDKETAEALLRSGQI